MLPILYKKSLMGHSAGDILRYYAERELQDFSFLLCRPMIDMMWIRAGFTWEEEDGDTDLVPRIINEFGDDFVSKLKDTQIECEHDFLVVFAHIMEIIDLSIYPEKLRIQLISTFEKKLKHATGTTINSHQAENILFRCGLK